MICEYLADQRVLNRFNFAYKNYKKCVLAITEKFRSVTVRTAFAF